MTNNKTKKKAVIIPIASGKGGVGKSFLTANLAMALAGLGHKTIAVDLDLGGSNLHSFLGLPNKYHGVGDFLKARHGDLADLKLSTSVPQLQYIPGDGKTPFMANINFAQKKKLITQIRKLEAEYVLLDLGAGASFNTLDFWCLSHRGLIITTPEHHTIMNMLVFMKNFMLRVITRNLSNNYPVLNKVQEMLKQPLEHQINSIAALIQEIKKMDAVTGQKIQQICQSYRPRLVFNEGNHPDDLKVSTQINKSILNILSLEVDYFGFIFFDQAVRKAIRSQTPFLTKYPNSPAGKGIRKIAERVVKYWYKSIKDSSTLLKQHISADFQENN